MVPALVDQKRAGQTKTRSRSHLQGASYALSIIFKSTGRFQIQKEAVACLYVATLNAVAVIPRKVDDFAKAIEKTGKNRLRLSNSQEHLAYLAPECAWSLR